MSVASFAIRRPIFVIMVSLIVIIMGTVALLKLPVDMMPDITFPALTIMSEYEDASPEEVEELLTRPIEESISSVQGVKEIRSSSSEGRSTVRVSFEWDIDIDDAANDIRDRIDRTINQLPDDIDRPVLYKFDAASAPVCMLGCESSGLNPVQLRKFIEDQIQPRLERIDGVGNINILGGRKREIHVDLDPDKVRNLNIATTTILSVLKNQNLTLPAGTIDAGKFEVLLRTPGHYKSLEEIRDTIVEARNGSVIRIRDLATVSDSWEKESTAVHINGKTGIRMMVYKQSDRNTVAVVDAVLRELDRINRDFPESRVLLIRSNADFIRNSISNVGDSAWQGGLLAVLVILFFLRRWSMTFVIATSIPISMIATFALIYFSGYTLNIMTLGGLALGVGMLVDNSIVVLENIFRVREEEHLDHIPAGEKGTSEVAAPILASTMTTLVIFLPMFFLEGMTGIMFTELAAVICFSLMSSYVTAITLVPMLTVQFSALAERRRLQRAQLRRAADGTPLAPEHLPPEQHGRIFRAIGHFLDELTTFYQIILRWALFHWKTVSAIVVALCVAVFGLQRFIGSEMMPETDESQLNVRVDLEVGTRVGVTNDIAADVEQFIIRNVPEYERMASNIGGSIWRGSAAHSASISVYLVKPKFRSRTSDEIANDLRAKLLGRYPGATIRVDAGVSFFTRLMGGGADSRVEIDVRGYDMETGDALAQQAKYILEGIPGVTDVRISRETGTPEELFGIDRVKASALGLDVDTIASFLECSVAGETASYYREDGDEYKILVKMANADKLSLAEIHDQIITNRDGKPINLRNITTTSSRKGPVRIDRKNKERIVTLYCNITDTDIGTVIAQAQPKLDALLKPADFSIVPAGNWEDQVEAFQQLIAMFALAIVLVYMVMACQYESLMDPFVVMFSVPLAAIGVLVMLFITNTTINMQSAIGCIMLAGIVVNNAIILVDQIKQLREEQGWNVFDAIMESARRRLRPILMTTLTTVLGLIPMALGLGEGGESTAPLARAVIGGLCSSTLVTLIFIPIVYMVLRHGLQDMRQAREAHANHDN